jgi:hypothetical protein
MNFRRGLHNLKYYHPFKAVLNLQTQIVVRRRTMGGKKIKKIPIKELRQEEGASDLATSPDMQPYLQYIMAAMQGTDVQPHLEELSKLPPGKTIRVAGGVCVEMGLCRFR